MVSNGIAVGSHGHDVIEAKDEHPDTVMKFLLKYYWKYRAVSDEDKKAVNDFRDFLKRRKVKIQSYP